MEIEPIALDPEVNEAITWTRQRGWGELVIHSLPALGPEEWLRQVGLVRRACEGVGRAPIEPAPPEVSD